MRLRRAKTEQGFDFAMAGGAAIAGAGLSNDVADAAQRAPLGGSGQLFPSQLAAPADEFSILAVGGTHRGKPMLSEPSGLSECDNSAAMRLSLNITEVYSIRHVRQGGIGNFIVLAASEYGRRPSDFVILRRRDR